MTPQFWNHIQPQLDEVIFNELSDTQTAYDLTETLTSPSYWWEQSPFNNMRVWFENADLTFLEWMNACEAFMGPQLERIFEEELKKRLIATVERQYEIRIREIGEEERRAAA